MAHNLEQVLETLEAALERKKYRAIDFFRPYPKQQVFFDLGATKRERLLKAGNQQGKTHAGAFEAACHATGEYPADWHGRRWDRPTKGWACGETGVLLRDGPQKKLFGEPGVEAAFGTGFIPKASILDKPSLARGVTDAYDTVQVRHKSGGTSIIKFKSYEQGRTKFQSETLDWVWDDEEPPMDIYTEELARISATNGIIFTTFTSLKGMNTLVERFLKQESPDRATITMTMLDADHFARLSPEERQKIIDGYPAHERAARVYGEVLQGSGRVFITAEETLKFTLDPEMVPIYWVKLWGIDFGVAHPFAAVLIAWDRDNDVVYVLNAIRYKAGDNDKNLPYIHAGLMKPIGAAVPVAWPHDGTQREKGSGESIARIYKKEGLLMLPSHATHVEGGFALEPGIMELDDRMATGRFKVAAHLTDWFEEYRNYHRNADGQVIKERDDLMSATRIAVMMKRHAKAIPLGSKFNLARNRQSVANDVDFNPF